MSGVEQRIVDGGSPIEMAPTRWRTSFRYGGEQTFMTEENDNANLVSTPTLNSVTEICEFCAKK